MTAANKYSCKLDGRDKDCINDPPQAEEGMGGGKVRRRQRKGREGKKFNVGSQSMLPYTE